MTPAEIAALAGSAIGAFFGAVGIRAGVAKLLAGARVPNLKAGISDVDKRIAAKKAAQK